MLPFACIIETRFSSGTMIPIIVTIYVFSSYKTAFVY